MRLLNGKIILSPENWKIMDPEFIPKSDIKNISLEEFLKLIEGEDVNKIKVDGHPLLFSLIEYKRIDIIERLENIDMNVRNSYGETPLIFSASRSQECLHDINRTKLLLERGANVNDKNNSGNTLFQYYVSWDKTEFASYLLKCGADINLKNDLGYNPLRIACYYKHMIVLEFLLQEGAKVEYDEKGIPECLIPIGMHFHPSRGEIEEMKNLILKYETKNKKGAKRE